MAVTRPRPHPGCMGGPDWSYVNADGTFGNRYDDPEGQYRVLYVSTEREATFRESLARFRADPAIVAVEISSADDEGAPVTIAAGVSAGDMPTFAGIRYGSRLGDNLTSWAIFAPNEPHVIESRAEIDPTIPICARRSRPTT